MILSTSREVWFYFSLLLECGTFSSFLQAWVSFKVPARRPFPRHLRWLLCYAFQKAVPPELRKSRVAGFLFAWAWVCPGDHWGGSSDTGVRVWRMPRPQDAKALGKPLDPPALPHTTSPMPSAARKLPGDSDCVLSILMFLSHLGTLTCIWKLLNRAVDWLLTAVYAI